MLFHLIVFLRWARLTTRRYGFVALFTGSRPKRAGVGHGVRRNPLGRAHQAGTDAMYLVRQIRLERSLLAAV